jgi:hypothetical protein
MHSLKLLWSTSSIGLKVALGAGLLGLILIGGVGVHLWRAHTIAGLTKQQEQLKQENQRITDSYNQAIGQAKAFELSAREEKAKADALIETIEAGTKNVKALDEKLAGAQRNYDQAKSDLGDCADNDDCLRRLHTELCAAGFKLKDCPK